MLPSHICHLKNVKKKSNMLEHNSFNEKKIFSNEGNEKEEKKTRKSVQLNRSEINVTNR